MPGSHETGPPAPQPGSKAGLGAAASYDPERLRSSALARFGPEKLVENLTQLYDDAIAANV